MPRKPREQSSARISEGLQQRIEKLSELLWASNRSRMARDLGIDQSTISKVLARKQEPSAKLLEKLAGWLGVNPVWLFTDEGDPQVQGGTRPGVGSFRPIVDELLPGPPSAHRERMTGISYPVAAAFDSPTCYWYRVPPNTPITRSSYCVRGGDLLLMETGDDWTRKSFSVPDKFFGFLNKTGRKTITELAWVDAVSKTSPPFDHPYEQYRVDRFGTSDEPAWFVVPEGISEKDARRSISGLCLFPNDVVCVCIKLERPFLREATPRNPVSPKPKRS